ncbi:MAG: hypothetical protein P8X70_01245 [Nanoarchaeota archaeon]
MFEVITSKEQQYTLNIDGIKLDVNDNSLEAIALRKKLWESLGDLLKEKITSRYEELKNNLNYLKIFCENLNINSENLTDFALLGILYAEYQNPDLKYSNRFFNI